MKQIILSHTKNYYELMFSLKILIVVLSISFLSVDAERANEIWISISEGMEDVIFDGKWTNYLEWKRSSLDSIQDEKTTLYIRSAHQGNFIYFLLDFVSDTHLDTGEDKAMICLNPQEEPISDEQFCFFSTLGTDNSKILKKTINSENFVEINYENFVGISNVSDENDRYSPTPHSTYEFKIPTDLVERNSEYGLYIAVYEANADRIVTFPTNLNPKNFDDIPEVTKWGKLVSPDKSLPEFHWFAIITITSISLVIILTRTRSINYFK